MMAFIGVRNSWLMFARNSDFARFADSASAVRCSSCAWPGSGGGVTWLVLQAALARRRAEDFLTGPYPIDTQHELSLVVARAFGADERSFRLDPTVHPFASGGGNAADRLAVLGKPDNRVFLGCATLGGEFFLVVGATFQGEPADPRPVRTRAIPQHPHLAANGASSRAARPGRSSGPGVRLAGR